MPEPNYLRECFKSQWNLLFLAVMACMGIVLGDLFGFILLASIGEVGIIFLSQNKRLQRVIRSSKNKSRMEELASKEQDILSQLRSTRDYEGIYTQCNDILDKAASNVGEEALAILVDKLAGFRLNYLKLLKIKDTVSLLQDMSSEVKSIEQSIHNNESLLKQAKTKSLKDAILQNIELLNRRRNFLKNKEELQYLIETRLTSTKNSLNLIRDRVYMGSLMSSDSELSSLVDNLVSDLDIQDELSTDLGMSYLDVGDVISSGGNDKPKMIRRANQ